MEIWLSFLVNGVAEQLLMCRPGYGASYDRAPLIPNTPLFRYPADL